MDKFNIPAFVHDEIKTIKEGKKTTTITTKIYQLKNGGSMTKTSTEILT